MKHVTLLFALLLFVGAGCVGGPTTEAPEVQELPIAPVEQANDTDIVIPPPSDGTQDVDDTVMGEGNSGQIADDTPQELPEPIVPGVEPKAETETQEQLPVEEPVVKEVEALTISLTASNFKYVDTSGATNPTLRVAVGQEVTVTMPIESGFHNIVIDELDVESEAIGSGSTSVTFVPTEPGTYSYYCSVGSHRAQGMEGTIIVE